MEPAAKRRRPAIRAIRNAFEELGGAVEDITHIIVGIVEEEKELTQRATEGTEKSGREKTKGRARKMRTAREEGALDCATRRVKNRRGRKSRAAPLGM